MSVHWWIVECEIHGYQCTLDDFDCAKAIEAWHIKTSDDIQPCKVTIVKGGRRKSLRGTIPER